MKKQQNNLKETKFSKTFTGTSEMSVREHESKIFPQRQFTEQNQTVFCQGPLTWKLITELRAASNKYFNTSQNWKIENHTQKNER